MRLHTRPSSLRSADVTVPGDKSIAHRWLMLASVGEGSSQLNGLSGALDVRSTARCLAKVAPAARGSLAQWAELLQVNPEVPGFTWDASDRGASTSALRVEGEGWKGLAPPTDALDCGNSGTTMRLLIGLLAAGP